MRAVYNRPKRRFFTCVWCVAALLVIIGCENRPSYQPVTGRITLDGQPLAEADVAFLPDNDQGIASFGQTNAQGEYELRHTQSLTGAPVGAYQVRITTFREAKEDSETGEPLSEERVPPRFNLSSELTAKVVEGENRIDFELHSRSAS